MEFINQQSGFSLEEGEKSFLLLQSFILEKQKNNTPFFIGRLSGNETNLCGIIINQLKVPIGLVKLMLLGAGIQLKSPEEIFNYAKIYHTAVLNTNLLGVWDSTMYKQGELFYNYINKFYPNIKRICASYSFYPYSFMNHPAYKFNTIFENKKVLIITSHKETVKKQIESYDKLFNKPIFHSTTSFYIYKPPQQNGGSHDTNSYTFHFENMKKDIAEIKKEFAFDIALVSCGGFGMLISDYIYTDLKSSVIYVGGALQLFFGIIGNRWINSPDIKKLMNNYWTNVLDVDKPANIKLCEDGCYW
jgi:hypothetical protein